MSKCIPVKMSDGTTVMKPLVDETELRENLNNILTTFIMQYNQKIKIGNKHNIEATQRAEESLLEILTSDKQRLLKRLEKYEELIMAVGNKFEGETRHQTALRYIKQAEEGSDNQAKSVIQNKLEGLS